MKKETLTAVFAMLALLPAANAQTTQEQVIPQGEQKKELRTDNLPTWLVDFSNLPRADRDKYLQGFGRAKQFFQKGDWHGCILELTNCEIIFNKNPNSWNLRLSCLIELKDLSTQTSTSRRLKRYCRTTR